MRVLLFLCVLVAIAFGKPSDTQTCLVSGNYTVLGTDGIFGCSGYGNSISIIWNVTDPNPRLLTFLSFQTETCCDKVTISYGSTVLGPFSGPTNPGAFMFGGGNVIVKFVTDATNTYSGFAIQLSAAPAFDILKSGQPLQKNIQSEGFTYFGLPVGTTAFGTALSVSLSVNSFDGLQNPTLFMSTNRLPSLESYNFINDTVASGGRYVASFNIVNPGTAQYYIGVFLYGNVASLTISAVWTYNVPRLLNGVKNTTVVNTGSVIFQLYTPKLTKSLNIQISRQVPGGFPIAYIAQGYIPDSQFNQWVMDTTRQSYISLTINSPNPTVNYNANPGLYLISVISAPTANPNDNTVELLTVDVDKEAAAEKKQVQFLSAGFILMATWA